jgi:NitT/TauT family transport system permease protein
VTLGRRVLDSSLVWAVLAIVVGIAAWQIVSTVIVQSFLFPSASQTFHAFRSMWSSGELTHNLALTGYRVALGAAAGAATGVALGFLVGVNAYVRSIADPYVNYLRSIAAIAWVSPAVVWFGIGKMPIIFVAGYATLFVVLINTAAGVAHIPSDRIRMARAFGASPRQAFLAVVFPSVVPFIMTGLRIAIGAAVMAGVAGEMVGSNSGIGYVLYQDGLFLRSANVFAGLIVLGVIGFCIDRCFVFLQKATFGKYELAHD